MDAPEIKSFKEKDWVWFYQGCDQIFGRVVEVQPVSAIVTGRFGRMTYMPLPGKFRYRVLDVVREGSDVTDPRKCAGFWRGSDDLLLAKDEEVFLYMMMR